jgi:pentatricopeptide repeat protein
LGFKPDHTAIATLVVQYGQGKQLEQAQELFESASALFLEGANVYNAMVDAFCKCGKTEDAYHLFMEMVDQGSNRDAVTVSILVTHLTKHGKGFLISVLVLWFYSAAACYVSNSF